MSTDLLLAQEPCPPLVSEESIDHDEDGERCVDAGDYVNRSLRYEFALLSPTVAAEAH